jgi:two-component system, cell cycle response regulator
MIRKTPIALTPAFWRRLFAPREAELTDAGEAGELLVARARLILAALILIVPLVSVAREPARAENWVGVAAAGASTLLSAAIVWAVSRGWRPRWLGFATCLYDVTTVSCVLASFLVVGPPHMAINSRVTFEIYFVALAATCLRYDRRICTVTGLVAALQYALLVWFAVHRWELNDPAWAPFPYGTFSAPDQVGRIVLLLVATLLSATIVDRTERLRVLSTHDGLTDVYNRAYFNERLVEEVLRAHRYQRPLALAIIDLDHFKQVNDERGHVAGDVALRRFADLVRGNVRRTDIVARFGGEEFAIILPETTAGDALAKLEQIRQQVQDAAIDLPRGGGTLHLTFSAGVAALPGDAGRPDDLVTRADARLLAAKAGGRNRVMGAQKLMV